MHFVSGAWSYVNMHLQWCPLWSSIHPKKYKWTFNLSVSDESLMIHRKHKTLNQIKNWIKALLFCHSTASCSNIHPFVPFLSSFVHSIPKKWTVTGAEESLSSKGFYTVNRVEREHCFCCRRRLPHQGCKECCFFHLFYLVVHMCINDNSKGVCVCVLTHSVQCIFWYTISFRYSF